MDRAARAVVVAVLTLLNVAVFAAPARATPTSPAPASPAATSPAPASPAPVSPAPVSPAPVPPAPPPVAAPAVGLHVTTPQAAGGPDCSWASYAGCSYVRAQVALIDAVPGWSGAGPRPQVWMSLYSSNQPALTDAAVRADARGVAVHLLTWRAKTKGTGTDSDHEGLEPTGERKRIVDLLSRSGWSEAAVIRGSGFAGGNAGRMHAKLTLTYDPYARAYRTMSASGNSVMWTDDTAWNDFTVLGARKHYLQAAEYLRRAMKDRRQKTPRPTTSGGVTLYLFPLSSDPLLDRLKATRPRAGQTCTVRVDVWSASDSRRVRRYVDQLVRIRRAGGVVRVVADSSTDAAAVPNWPATVVRRLQQGGVTVLDGRGPAGVYVNHEKSVSVAGCGKADGDWRGSANWRMASTTMENQTWQRGTAAGLAGVARDDQIAAWSRPWPA